MAVRPIIFSAPMVRALLAGRKTQTRRVPDLPQGVEPYRAPYGSGAHLVWEDDDGAVSRVPRTPAVGDTLWVRETCRAEELDDGSDGVRYLADGHWQRIENSEAASAAWVALFHYRGRPKGVIGNTVTPIHMPRWASRLTLRVTDVRVQRLQDISEADAIAEGFSDWSALKNWDDPRIDERPIETARRLDWSRREFAALWNEIHGSGSWDANQWVAAISFDVIRENVDKMEAK